MDNLFGKMSDSENENDHVDIMTSDTAFGSDLNNIKDDIDIEDHEVKTELDNCETDAPSDIEMPPASDLSSLSTTDFHASVIKKEEKDKSTNFDASSERVDDIFHNDIVLPQAPPPVPLKERRESKEKNKKELEEEEREKMQVLVSNFTEDQLDRYEMYRRAAFPKAAIKRIMQTITGCSVSQNVVIAMSGIAKVFVGEIVEEAFDVMEANNETGPLQPKHLRESVRRLRRHGQIPTGRARKTLYRL